MPEPRLSGVRILVATIGHEVEEVLFTAVLQDQHDEWQDGRRHFSQQSMVRVLHPEGPALLTNPLTEGLVA